MITRLYRILEFGKRSGAPGWIRRKTWRAGKNDPGLPVKPVLRCNCGHILGLSEYRVAADGRVTPEFEHSMADAGGCGWKVWLELADYTDGEFRPAPKSAEARK